MKDGKSSDDLEQLLDYLKNSRGFDFAAYKRGTLARRIEKRMAAVNIESYSQYLDHLQVHQDEFAELFNAILINVTSFFRDAEVFDYLRTAIIPKVVHGSDATTDRQIRVWSAGCASGEEVYSVGMLFAETLGIDQVHDRVKFYATDVDEEELAIARAAIYTERQVEGLSPELRAKYFEPAGAKWSLKKELRRTVIFGRHDLLDD